MNKACDSYSDDAMSDVRFEVCDVVPAVDLLALYRSVDWENYVGEPDLLVRAVDNSSFVATATVDTPSGDEELVGLVRVLTDSVSVVFIQDLLVRPDHQRRGIATGLMELVFARFDGVRRFVLLADPEPGLDAFYQSVGFTRQGDGGPLVTYVR